MKPGDKVICVLLDANQQSDRLTIGKSYTVVKGHNPVLDTISILDNEGSQSQYYRWRFETIKQSRKRKLKKLNLLV